MRYTIERVIEDAFKYVASPTLSVYNNTALPEYGRLWEVLVKGDEVEIPLCFWHSYLHCAVEDRDISHLVLPVYHSNSYTASTGGTLVKGAFNHCLYCGGFSRLECDKGGYDDVYYGTKGVILDKDFSPVWVCAWRIRNEDGLLSYAQPVVRYSSRLFFKKNDLVASYLSTTLFKKLLALKVENPARRYSAYPVSILIDPVLDFPPYAFHEVQKPSASVTDRELRQLALSHVDRFFEYESR